MSCIVLKFHPVTKPCNTESRPFFRSRPFFSKAVLFLALKAVLFLALKAVLFFGNATAGRVEAVR